MKAAVATGHYLTSQVAEEILAMDGNAVDAAIGAYAVACVAEPAMASMAAGGFAMIMMGNQPECLDFFCQTPRRKIPNARMDPIPVDFGTAQEQYYSGIGSVAVPGAVRGLFEMHSRFGRMPMKDILQPAVEWCKTGLELTPFQAFDLKLLHSVFTKEKRGEELFTIERRIKRAGEHIALPNMSDFLDVLAKEGDVLFYEGEIAQQIQDISNILQGHISYQDMTQYKAIWRKPANVKFGSLEMYTPPAPSMGHALMKEYLNTTDSPSSGLGSLFQRGQAFRNLLTDQAKLFAAAGLPFTGQSKFSGTSHMNILDKNGGAVAMTFSIGEGSGIFLHGTDIHLNNMLGEPSLLPNGLDSWTPGTRLASMMTPTMAFVGSQLKYLLGSGGAERIASMLSQTIMYLNHGLSLKEAVESPRTYLSDRFFEIEPGFHEVIEQPNFRYWEKSSLYFGGVHGIEVGEDVFAVGDQRREGHAKVLDV